MSLHKHGLKINIDDVKNIAKVYHRYSEKRNYFRIYYDKSTGRIWENEYVDCRSYTQYDNNDILEIYSFSSEPLTQQKIIDAAAAAVYNIETECEFKKRLYYSPTIQLY